MSDIFYNLKVKQCSSFRLTCIFTRFQSNLMKIVVFFFSISRRLGNCESFQKRVERRSGRINEQFVSNHYDQFNRDDVIFILPFFFFISFLHNRFLKLNYSNQHDDPNERLFDFRLSRVNAFAHIKLQQNERNEKKKNNNLRSQSRVHFIHLLENSVRVVVMMQKKIKKKFQWNNLNNYYGHCS